MGRSEGEWRQVFNIFCGVILADTIVVPAIWNMLYLCMVPTYIKVPMLCYALLRLVTLCYAWLRFVTLGYAWLRFRTLTLRSRYAHVTLTLRHQIGIQQRYV